MQSISLGKSGRVVSRLGLGLAALGRPGYINLAHALDLPRGHDVEAMEAHAHRVLDAAWAAGIRYFDAARSYGRAEHFLASWLTSRGITPGTATIGSKWGYTYTAGWKTDAEQHEVKAHSLAELQRQLAESQELLGEQLALYQIHSATRESGVLEDRAVLTELTRLRAGGMMIGLTVSGPGQSETLRRALDITVDGVPLFGCVQATWNLLERAAGAALQEAHGAGVRVIVKEALANGRLTARNGCPSFAPRGRILDAIASQLQTTVDALSLAAVLAQPWADVVLSGAATPEQLRSNTAALGLRYDEEINDRLSKLAEDSHEYWTNRSRLRWN